MSRMHDSVACISVTPLRSSYTPSAHEAAMSATLVTHNNLSILPSMTARLADRLPAFQEAGR